MTVANKATRWQRKLAKRESQKAVIGSLADSHTESVGATMAELGWTALAARALARDITEGQSLGGTSVSPQAPQARNISGSYDLYDSRNPHVVELKQGGIMAFYELYAYTFIDVFYMLWDGNGTYKYVKPEYRINGGSWQTFTTPENVLFEPGTKYCTSRIENWPGGTLELRAPAGVDHVFLFPIIAHRGWNADLGVKWINWGRSGYSSADVLDKLNDYLWAEPLKAMPFDMLHIGLGANDIAQNLTVQQTVDNITDIIDWYHANVADVPVLLTLSPYPDAYIAANNAPVSEADWNARMDAIAGIADDYEDTLVSDWRGMGTQSETLDLWLPNNDDHFNNAGHRFLSNVAFDVLKPGS